MIRHNLTARSLRHLRFARRMMAGQPLLARAVSLDRNHPNDLSAVVAPAALVSLGGYQLPVGRVLRRLPRSETVWADSVVMSDEPASDATIPPVALPADMPLRLLPRLSEPDALPAEVESGSAIGQAPHGPSDRADQPFPRRSVDTPSSASSSPPPTDGARPPQPPVLARTGGPRPRSRIVELPGVISLPVDDEAGGEGTPPAVSREHEPAMAAPSLNASDTERSGPVLDQPLPSPVPAPEAGKRPGTANAANAADVKNVEATPLTETTTPPTPAARRRSGRRAEERHPRASDALFPPTDGDRSPQTWLARLQQAGKPAPAAPATSPAPSAPTPPDDEPPSPTRQRSSSRGTRRSSPAMRNGGARATSAPVERPAELPDSSRALLRETTGIDPVNVPVYRGPEAERVTSAHNADALTDGSAIALGVGHAADTPETLGLLGHELTHVAHRRKPRFVPPVAAAPAMLSPLQRPATSSADEEAQAAQVEARVTRIAHARKAAQPEPLQEPQRPEKSVTPVAPAGQWQAPPDARPVWGNLPAPWEPLPDWMVSPSSPASAPASTPQPTSPHVPTSVAQSAQVPTSASARASSPDAAGIQRAERGRSLPASENEPSPAQPAHEGDAPEPDLDALAQQVHAILKRRLAAERRRFG